MTIKMMHTFLDFDPTISKLFYNIYSDLPKVYIQFHTFQELPHDICYLLYGLF